MKVLMPQLGETVTEGTVSKWHKKIGDNVKIGEVLFEIETDKTSMEIPATSDGKLSKIHVTEGETSSVGATVAIIIGNNEEDEKETEQSEPTKEADKSQTKDQKEENSTVEPQAVKVRPVYLCLGYDMSSKRLAKGRRNDSNEPLILPCQINKYEIYA